MLIFRFIFVFLVSTSTFTCFTVKKIFFSYSLSKIPVFTICLKCSVLAPVYLKGQFKAKSKIHIFLVPVVLFINLDSFGASCLVFEISAV